MRRPNGSLTKVAAGPGAPVGVVRPGLFHRLEFAVSDVGETVELRLGNAVLGLHYEDALSLAALLRLHAKAAKRTAGDGSRSWRALGLLEDANGPR